MAEKVSVGPGSPSALRAANCARVLSAIADAGELSQADLAVATGLSTATISNLIKDLSDEGRVTAVAGTGRRKLVRLARAAGVIVGIDYGHRHVTVGVADLAHHLLASERAELEDGISAEDGMAVAGDMLTRVMKKARAKPSDVVRAGMGLPAPIDRATGKVGSPTILPGWVGIDAAGLASKVFGLPVVADNDANLGALAERRWGAGRTATNLAYFKLSEGVGAGLIVDGALFTGPDGTAGEIGHTTVDEFGAFCRCGNRGCLETIISARSVVDLLAPTRPGLDSIADVVAAATAGDHACIRVLDDVGRRVGRAVADLCNLMNPELVVVGGELAQAGDFFLDVLRREVARYGIPSAVRRLRVVPSELGPMGHLWGAIALGMSMPQRTGEPMFKS